MYPLLEAYPKLNLGKRFTEPLLKVICLSVKIPSFSTASLSTIINLQLCRITPHHFKDYHKYIEETAPVNRVETAIAAIVVCLCWS